VTDTPNRARPIAAGAKHEHEADGPFLRRILFGLIAATILTAAVTLALTSQHELIERLQVASTQGPA
jgi:hypothetical protein